MEELSGEHLGEMNVVELQALLTTQKVRRTFALCVSVHVMRGVCGRVAGHRAHQRGAGGVRRNRRPIGFLAHVPYYVCNVTICNHHQD